MSVFAAVRERKARGIVKAARRAMNHLGNEGERLQSTRTELFKEQQLGEVVQIALVGNCEHGAKSLEIDVG